MPLALGVNGLIPPTGISTWWGGLQRLFPRWGRGYGPHGCPQWHVAPPQGFHNHVPPARWDGAESGQPAPAPAMTRRFSRTAKPAQQRVEDGRPVSPPIPGRTLGLRAKVQRELGSASVSPARERWHPELGDPGHPNQSRAAAACAGPVVAEEAPGLGQQPGVVAPGGGWHRSGAPAGAGEEREGRVRIRGGCWLCCCSEPCRERALRPGVRSPTVAQGYCDPPLHLQASVKTLESLSFLRPGRPPSIRSLLGTCCSAGDSMWDPHVVN